MRFWVRESLTEFYVSSDATTTVDLVVAKLGQMGLEISRIDKGAGQILVRYLSLLTDWLLYRCYSDHILVEVKDHGPDESIVKVYAIPSWNRASLRRGEVLRELAPVWYQLEKLGSLQPRHTNTAKPAMDNS